MALSRREFQILQERVTRLENKLRALEERMKVYDNVLKPENLLRRVRDGEAEEKRKAEMEDLFLGVEETPATEPAPHAEEAAAPSPAAPAPTGPSAWAEMFLPPDLEAPPDSGEAKPGS